MQKISDHVGPDTSTKQLLYLRLRDHFRGDGRKIARNQSNNKFSVRFCFVETNEV